MTSYWGCPTLPAIILWIPLIYHKLHYSMYHYVPVGAICVHIHWQNVIFCSCVSVSDLHVCVVQCSVVGASLSGLYCMYGGLWSLAENLNWVHLSVSQRLNVHVHFSSVESDSKGLLPECSVKEAWSEDDSNWSTRGSLRMVYYCKLSQLRTTTGKHFVAYSGKSIVLPSLAVCYQLANHCDGGEGEWRYWLLVARLATR